LFSKISLKYKIISLMLVMSTVFSMFSANSIALSNLGINDNPYIDQVIISSFELPLQEWYDNGSFKFVRDDVSFFIEDKFTGGVELVFTELDNRDVFVSVELTSDFVDIYSIGSIASENGVPLYWNILNGSAYLNLTLTARAEETFKISGFSAFKYKLDYGYRSKFRAINGDSVRLDVVCNNNTPNVFILIEKEFNYYGNVLEIIGDSVMVKYKVAHGFKYPITENRNHLIWYVAMFM
jgi:hypothetical protein